MLLADKYIQIEKRKSHKVFLMALVRLKILIWLLSRNMQMLNGGEAVGASVWL